MRKIICDILLIFLLILVVTITQGCSFEEDRPSYELEVRLYPESHRVVGKGRIAVPHLVDGYITNQGITLTNLKVGGEVVDPIALLDGRAIRVGKGERVDFAYEGLFVPEKEGEVIENIGVTGSNIVDKRGIMLLSGWYPEFSKPCIFSLKVTLPSELEAVSESDVVTVTSDEENGVKTVKFSFPYPIAGITLIGGKYAVSRESFRGVEIATYFFPGESHLSRKYTDNMKRFIELYGELLGDYPYRSFNIVENIFQTGYSFPTYTLLGSRIVGFQYVPEISLGHEFLHQWFGHYVNADYERGNWTEGLTTYLADHWYEEMKGEGYRYRKKIIMDYTNYVSPESDIPLVRFRGRVDFATRAVGYGKTAMVFHMVRKKMGDDAFFAALRNFIDDNGYKKAGWADLRKSFMETSGEDLALFFERWTGEKGMADLTIEPPVAVRRGDTFHLKMNLIQKSGPYIFDLPVRVETETSKQEFSINVDRSTVHFERQFASKPLKVFIDEHYDTFRRLTDGEIPPAISGFTGDKESLVIVPERERKELGGAIEFFEKQGYRVVGSQDADENLLNRSSYLIISSESEFLKNFQEGFQDLKLPEGGFVVRVVKNPKNSAKVAMFIQYEDAGQFFRAYKKIFRYGNYSHLVFEKGKNVYKKIEDSARGIILDVMTK